MRISRPTRSRARTSPTWTRDRVSCGRGQRQGDTTDLEPDDKDEPAKGECELETLARGTGATCADALADHHGWGRRGKKSRRAREDGGEGGRGRGREASERRKVDGKDV